MQAIAEIEEKIVQVDRQIEIERHTETVKKGTCAGEVIVIIGADTDSHVDLKLIYSKLKSLSPLSLANILSLTSRQQRIMGMHIRTSRQDGERQALIRPLPPLPGPHYAEHRGGLDRHGTHSEHRRV